MNTMLPQYDVWHSGNYALRVYNVAYVIYLNERFIYKFTTCSASRLYVVTRQNDLSVPARAGNVGLGRVWQAGGLACITQAVHKLIYICFSYELF